ncbi:hypothetical protein GQ600_7684 [Phytophthora cactorum]|nr:hypothetical protein GQ600_7684 [Phytophthora cactorum]
MPITLFAVRIAGYERAQPIRLCASELLEAVKRVHILLYGKLKDATDAKQQSQETTAESNLIDRTVINNHVTTSEVSDQDPEDVRKSGGGGGGGRGRSTRWIFGGYLSGRHVLLMNTNGVTSFEECNRFTNWWKRLFNKEVKQCPKKSRRRRSTTLSLSTT